MKQPYQLSVENSRHYGGMEVISVDVRDKYHARKYSVERGMVRAFTGALQRFLKANPELAFESRRNVARILTYLPSGMKAWRAYVPGGFATYYVHKPDQKHMAGGGTLDVITRRFFRHAYDSVGLRARAYILSWLVHEKLKSTKGKLTWISIAAGSGQPVYDLLQTTTPAERSRLSVVLTDINQDMLAFAQQLYHQQGAEFANIAFHTLDVTNHTQLKNELSKQPSIVDAMGLFEYLNAAESSALIRTVYEALPKGGVFIFTNMATSHPHLHVHQRALGWPGVIQRSVKDVCAIIEKAGVPEGAYKAYRATDKVYYVYRVEKQ